MRQPSRLSVNVVLYAVLAWHRIQRGHLQRPAEWPKLLRAARASLQVAGLLYGPGSGIGGSIRPVPGPIAGSRLGRPSRSAGQARGLPGAAKASSAGRSSIATGH